MQDRHKTTTSEAPSAIAPTAAAVTTAHKPEFIRLPPPGTACPWTGLKRSKLNELVLPCPANNFRPPVRSIRVTNKGQKKAVRLVVYQSLIDYLGTLEAK